jgi:hypothetical protein
MPVYINVILSSILILEYQYWVMPSKVVMQTMISFSFGLSAYIMYEYIENDNLNNICNINIINIKARYEYIIGSRVLNQNM